MKSPAVIERDRRRRENYMPLKIKALLLNHNLRQSELCAAVLQMDGSPISKTAMTRLYLHGEWPVRTPRKSIIDQSVAWLIDNGVPADEARAAFDIDEDEAANGSARLGRPTAKKPDTDTDDKPDFLEPCMLTPAARKHFRLFSDPFSVDVESTEHIFRGPDQAYAEEAVWEAVRNNRLFALVGESGSGKTTIIDAFKDRVIREHLPVKILQPMVADKKRLSGSAILEAIVRDLDPDTTLRSSNEARSRQAHQLLAERTEEGGHTVLFFEEAHDMSIDVLKLLKRFHEMKVGFRRTLSIVLAAQPELLTLLAGAATAAREVANRLEVFKLLPLDDQLSPYVAKRLERAGARVDDIFAPDTWDALHHRLTGVDRNTGERVSYCYPLLVNNHLTAAMNEAANLGAKRVDAAIVKGVRK